MTSPFAELADPTLCPHVWRSWYSCQRGGQCYSCLSCGARILVPRFEPHRADAAGPEWRPNDWIDWLRDDRPAPRAE